jgi:hypothetical protein
MFHFHKFEYLREEYRLCKNPAFEQRIIIRQCVHCPKIDEWADDTFRPTTGAVDGAIVMPSNDASRVVFRIDGGSHTIPHRH